jgi:O-antigen/teichoic acid export membrane protein
LSQAFGQEDNGRQFENVLTTSRTVLLFTNILYALLLVLLAIWCKGLFSFSEGIALEAKWGLILLAVWAIVRTPWLIFREGLNASQNMSSANLIGIVGNVCRLAFTLGLVILGFGLVGLILANAAAEALTLLLCSRRFRRLYPQINLHWGLPDRGLFREMFGFGKHALVINLAWRLVSGTDNLVVGFLYGAVATSIYYTTQMPTAIGYTLVNRLVDNLGPAINELYAKKDGETLNSLFLKLHRYALLLSSPLFAGILLLNKSMIDIWVGPRQYAGDLMTVALAGFALLTTMGHVSWVFIIATGKIRRLSTLSLLEGGVNLGLSFLLGYHYGVSGVMLATLLAHMPMVAFLQRRGMGEFGVDWRQYLRSVILPVFWPWSVAVTCTLVVLKVIPYGGWLAFGCASVVLLGVHAGFAYWFAVNAEERAWLRQKFRSAAQVVLV